MTLATDLMETRLTNNGESNVVASPTLGRSVPDAWIYESGQYCFLIEAKVGTYPLNDDQLRAHGSHWLGIDEPLLDEHLISLTWYQVLRVLHSVPGEIGGELNLQEAWVIESLIECLGYFGYRRFLGFDFPSMKPSPSISLHTGTETSIDFKRLASTPTFQLARQ